MEVRVGENFSKYFFLFDDAYLKSSLCYKKIEMLILINIDSLCNTNLLIRKLIRKRFI